jgi:hypothetical protein
MAAWLWFFAALVGCRNSAPNAGKGVDTQGPAHSPPAAPVLVMWTIDTLSESAANATNLCGLLTTAVAPYGLDAACLEGAVAPSSWTLESSVRTHWPTHASGAKRASMLPDCDDEPALARVVHGLGGRYALGVDNAAIDDAMERAQCSGLSPWQNGADFSAWAVDEGDYPEQLAVGEANRPARLALDQLLEWTRTGEPAAAWLLDFEGGGHVPRCFDDPKDDGCAQFWDYALANGLADAGDDPAERFASLLFWTDLIRHLKADPARGEMRNAAWTTTLAAAEAWQDSLVVPRLQVLLSGLAAQGRLADLQLVVYGDHGEAPCIDPLVGAGDDVVGDCSHGEFPSEWTARVPVVTIPASIADRWTEGGWVPTEGEAWSTTRLAYAFAGDYAGIPSDWPEPEAVGQATSLACFDSLQPVSDYGLRVLSDASVRCTQGECGTFTWISPVNPDDKPEPQASPDPALLALTAPEWGGETWFSAACHGTVED